MKFKLLILTIFTTFIAFQTQSQKMTYMKGGKINFDKTIYDKPYKIYPLISIIGSPELQSRFRKYKTSRGFSYTFAVIGGIAIGYPIGTALGGGKLNVEVLVSGIGIAALGFILESVANTNLKKMVDLYNGITSNKLSFQPFFQSSNGITNLGLLVKF